MARPGIPVNSERRASGRQAVDPMGEREVVNVRITPALCRLALVSCRLLGATYESVAARYERLEAIP